MSKEEKAREYADWLHKNLEEQLGYECAKHDMYYRNGDILQAFEVGWDEALKSQFRKCVDNKPIKGEKPKEGENVILLCQMIGGSNDGFVFPKVNTYKNGDWESKMLMRYNVIAWMPIPSFDEILNANKDVLKRLKGE